MDALEALTTRRSALQLAEPAPDDAALKQLLCAAARAPDHGRLRPWHIIVMRGDARARFGDLLAEALARREPNVPPAKMEAERKKPLRAPLLLVVGARIRESAKIPAVEQVISAGAAATNIMVAAHAMGFGAMWRTGPPAYDPFVKAGLGLALTDCIVGILYLGTPQSMPPQSKTIDFTTFSVEWTANTEPDISPAPA